MADKATTAQTEITADDLALVDPDRMDADAIDEGDAWKEFDEADQAAADNPPSDDDGDDDGAADDQQDEPADKQPAEGEAQPQAARQDTQAAAPHDPAFWSNLTEPQRRELDRLRLEAERQAQAARSNAGRVSVLQRQINQFQQGGAAQGQDRQQAAPAPAAAGQQAGAAATSLTSSPEFKKFVEEYPEIGGPMAKVIGEMSAALDQQGRFLAGISQERQSQAIAAQEQALAQEHPDWEQVTADPAFVSFVYAQPRHVQQAVQRNAEQIVDAREAGDVIARFKAASGRSAVAGEPPASAQPAKPAGDQPKSTRRQRQLESAQAVSTRGPGVSSAPSTDDEAALWKQLEREGL